MTWLEQYLLELTLIGVAVMIWWLLRRIVLKLDEIQRDVHGMAKNHGERLAVLETRADIIRQNVQPESSFSAIRPG